MLWIDLWAAGFSSEDEEEGSSQAACGGHDLDLLASLVEEREGETRGSTESSSAAERKETFEESLSKPDDVSLMRGTNSLLVQQSHTLLCPPPPPPSHSLSSLSLPPPLPSPPSLQPR